MRHNHFLFIFALIFSVFLSGCGSKSVKTEPDNPAVKAKEEFLIRYGFFVTSREKKELKNLQTLEEINSFVNKFWWGDKQNGIPSRDPDPATPEHELKDTIDKRLNDIRNEIFMTDFSIPGTLFGPPPNGFRSDMANVYLLYGPPHFKAKLSEGRFHTDLVIWYYFDLNDKPLFRFLFYNSYGTLKVFRNHLPILGPDILFDPRMSPLVAISNRYGLADGQELYDLWMELEMEDPDWAFRMPLFEFSYYTDIRLDEVLDPPEPAELVAVRTKPVVLGQPKDDIASKEFLNNSFSSFVPAEFIISGDNRPSFTLTVGYADVDWQVKGADMEFALDLRISFQHKVTKNIKEFSARLSKAMPREDIETKRKGAVINNRTVPVIMGIPLNDVTNFAPSAKPGSTLKQLVNELEPGEYVVNIDLRDPVTKKYSGGWREEITIK